VTRAIVLGVLAAACAACGSPSPVVPDATAPDAGAEAGVDAAPDAFPILPYPPGPYGNAIGDTMPDFFVEGYPLSRTQRDYTRLPFRDVSLSEVRSDPACSCLVVTWNASGWACPWCVMADVSFTSAMADDPGLCGLEVLAFDYDAVQNGAPPTRADLDDWVSANRESYPVGLPTPSLFQPLSAGLQGFVPTGVVLRTSDMKLVGLWTGVGNDMGAEARALCNLPRPGPETLASGIAPTALRIDDSHAYVLDDVDGLFRVPLAGGAKEIVAAASVAPGAFALDAVNVYFAATSGNGFAIEQVAKSGGSPITLDSSTSAFTDVAVDAGFVYGARADGVIERVPVGGGGAQTLVTGESDPGTLAFLDDAGLLLFIARATGEVAAVPEAGGQRFSVLPSGALQVAGVTVIPRELVMGLGELYVNGPLDPSALPDPNANPGAVFVLRSGVAPQQLYAGPETTIGLSPTGLFIGLSCTAGPCASIPQGSISMTGDNPNASWRTLTPGQPFLDAVAGDATYAYWTVGESAPGAHDGALRRIRQ
jgi:hypothetical protein